MHFSTASKLILMPRRRDVNQIRDRICDILHDAYPEVFHYMEIWDLLYDEFPGLDPRKLKRYLDNNRTNYRIGDYVEKLITIPLFIVIEYKWIFAKS